MSARCTRVTDGGHRQQQQQRKSALVVVQRPNGDRLQVQRPYVGAEEAVLAHGLGGNSVSMCDSLTMALPSAHGC
jgi:hypothetical protein